MRRCLSMFAVLLLVLGCAGPSAKEKYDEAVRDLERAQSRLDNLRPAYDVARQTAANAVCKEIAGTTPEESASAALTGLGDALNQTAAAPVEDGKKTEETKKAAGKKGDELDKTIDNLIAGEKNFQEKQASLAGPVAKANEVMAKIKTPGTPEAKRYAEKLASLPEVQAYERQQKRVERAQKDVDDAEAEMK
jgi:hypothetical protein